MTQYQKQKVRHLEDGSSIVDGRLYLSAATKQRLARENLRRLDEFRASMRTNDARSETNERA